MKDLQHQSDAKAHLAKWKVGALFMDAGTGKTKVAIDIVNSSPCDAVFWFAPLSTIRLNNIQAEVEKQGGFKIPARYVGIESIGQSDRIYLNVIEEIKKFKKPFIVVDESLKIKNAEAKRTKKLLEIGKLAEYKLILNGTPLSKNLLDVWAQMEFLSPKILSMSLRQYKNTFCCYTTITKQIGNRKYTKEFVNSYKNIDYLYSLIRHYVYKADLKLTISQNYKTVHYMIGDEERAAYGELKDLFLSDNMLEWRNNNIFLEMTQRMQHSYCCTSSKIDAVNDILKEVDPKKVIIFCKYVASRELCEQTFRDCKVLSYQKDSLGMNLQQYNITIYFDKIWDYALKTQSYNRTYRTGQEFDCVYYELTGDVGLETLIDRNISKKVSMSEYFKKATRDDLKRDL